MDITGFTPRAFQLTVDADASVLQTHFINLDVDILGNSQQCDVYAIQMGSIIGDSGHTFENYDMNIGFKDSAGSLVYNSFGEVAGVPTFGYSKYYGVSSQNPFQLVGIEGVMQMHFRTLNGRTYAAFAALEQFVVYGTLLVKPSVIGSL